MSVAPAGSGVPEDRSLEEFARDDATDASAPADPGGSPDGTEAAADERPADGPDGSDPDDGSPADPPATDGVAPAEPTVAVSPDGAACAGCGTAVTRRWRDDGEYVCADCKEW